MRKTALFFIIAAIVVGWFSSVSYAEEEKTSSNVEKISKQLGITVQEATELAAEMQNLAEIMGVKPKQEVAPETDKKTGPEVADKALNMVGKSVSVISAQIEKAAPEVWRIMVKQQYANAIFWAIIPLGFLIASLAYKIWSEKWTFKECCKDDQNMGALFRDFSQFVTLVASGIWLVIASGYSLRVIINPEYYAIRNMFQIVLGLS